MMKRIQLIAFAFVSFSLLFSFNVPYSKVPVLSDDNLLQDFVRINPDDSKPEILPTKAWLWHDEDALYIHLSAAIDSTFNPGLYSPRDNTNNGDYLRVQIFTIPQAYYGYYYMMYPYGSLYDGIRKDGAGLDVNWNSEYSYKTSHDDKEWVVAVRFPFKDMRFGKKPPYEWKIILTRYHKNSNESFSKPYMVNKMAQEYFTKGKDIVLSHEIKHSSNWKFKPYFVKSYDLVNKTDTFDPDHAGLDISYNPSTLIKLKASYNPDFTDVPPDDAQDNYNRKYPPYYAENRFFFIEDLNVFGTDSSIFYTRHIVQPQLAVKLTGSSKIWSYGYLGAQDKRITSNGLIINNDDIFQVATIARRTPKLALSLTGLSRMNEGYYNHIATGTLIWEFVKKVNFGTSQLISFRHNDNPSPGDKEDYQGNLTTVFLKTNPGNWNIQTFYHNYHKDLKVDMGRVYDTDYESYSSYLYWSSDTRESYLENLSLGLSGGYANNLDAARSFKSLWALSSISVSFKPRYSISLSSDMSRESWNNKEFDNWSSSVNFNWDKWQNPSFAVGSTIGETLVYSLDETHNYISPAVTMWLDIGKSFRSTLSLTHVQYGYARLNYIQQDTLLIPLRLDNCYQIGSAKLNYNFSNKLSLRNGLSLTNYDAYGSRAVVSFFSNFRYEFRKDSYLYLGYKSRQSQDEESGWSNPQGHFVRNAASAYLKVSLTL
jgi:hypothetical protein